MRFKKNAILSADFDELQQLLFANQNDESPVAEMLRLVSALSFDAGVKASAVYADELSELYSYGDISEEMKKKIERVLR